MSCVVQWSQQEPEGMWQMIKSQLDYSVQVIEHLDDHEYDDLLSDKPRTRIRSIAWPFNTVLESIWFDIPRFLFNRYPAIVEFLWGKLSSLLMKSNSK